MNNKRLKLGILFNFRSGWMGGIIYILNIIRMLDFLDEEDKPEITLFYRPDLKKYVDGIEYPYFRPIEWLFPSIGMGYVKSWLSCKNIFINNILQKFDLDGLYPMHDYPVKIKSKTKQVSWYADLQHEYYPEFFTKRKILERTARIKFILKNSDDLVVSSKAVSNDFKKFFKIRNDLNIHIFHFVSVIEDLSELNIEDLRTKYQLPAQYFMISNQFHKHKNHKILLNSLALLKEKGVILHFAFTGKFPDRAHSPYIQDLHDIVAINRLENQVSFLGIIPRTEQLLLMKYAQAVIQPSLFEGWSTVIEDAISLQAPVIASNLPVNIEQLGQDGVYFDPLNASELASVLSDYPRRKIQDVFYKDYNQRIKNAAEEFINIFS